MISEMLKRNCGLTALDLESDENKAIIIQMIVYKRTSGGWNEQAIKLVILEEKHWLKL